MLCESCLPFPVLFILLSSSGRLPAASLCMQIYLPPVCRLCLHLISCSTQVSRKLHLVLCRPPHLQIPAYAKHCCCLFASCPQEAAPYPFSSNTQAIARLLPSALLLAWLICSPETDFIPFLLQGLQPLNLHASCCKVCLYTFCYLLWKHLCSGLSGLSLQSLLYLPLKSSYFLPAQLFNLKTMLTLCVIKNF